jgi:hypothetical protein
MFNACIASACMLWVWDQRGAFVDEKYDETFPVEGHCGLVTP